MTVSTQQPDESSVTERLIELVNGLPEEKKQALLAILEDWHRTLQRKHPRKSCFMAVDYADRDRAFKDFIRNISAGGVFIETNLPFSIGKEITLTFSSSKYERQIKITGKIARTGRGGIGVRFKTENQDVIAMIKTL